MVKGRPIIVHLHDWAVDHDGFFIFIGAFEVGRVRNISERSCDILNFENQRKGRGQNQGVNLDGKFRIDGELEICENMYRFRKI